MTDEAAEATGPPGLVIVHGDDPLAVAHLTVRRRGPTASGDLEPVIWALLHGGFPVAAGVISPGQNAAETDLPELQDFVDDHALSVRASSQLSHPVAVDAVCSRPLRRRTRAETLAGDMRPGVRQQSATPLRGSALVAGRRLLRLAARPGIASEDSSPAGSAVARWVVVYGDYRRLLEQRRQLLRSRQSTRMVDTS